VALDSLIKAYEMLEDEEIAKQVKKVVEYIQSIVSEEDPFTEKKKKRQIMS
jgi:uncharacterized protein with ATP-grasp and redox domains